MKNKKGIEPVIATVLLIVITIAVVALVIAFVFGFVQKQMQKTELCYEAMVEIKEACYYDEPILKVRLGRGAEEFELTGMMLQASTATETNTYKITGGPGVLEEKTYEINTTAEFGVNSTEIVSIAIAPIVRSGETEKTCETTSTKTEIIQCLYHCFEKNCGDDDGSGIKECFGPCPTAGEKCKWENEEEQWECWTSGTT